MIHDDTSWHMSVCWRNIKKPKLWEDGHVVLPGKVAILRPGFFEPHLIGAAIVFKGQQGVEEQKLSVTIRWRCWRLEMKLSEWVWSDRFDLWWFWYILMILIGIWWDDVAQWQVITVADLSDNPTPNCFGKTFHDVWHVARNPWQILSTF